MNLNRVMLIGRLGKDPEVRYLENGAAVAKFSVATTEYYKAKSGEMKETTEWHDIILWRLWAEKAEKSLKKGKLVYVEGKLTHRKWQDADGNNRRSTEVVGHLFRLLEKRDNANSDYFPQELASDKDPTVGTKSTAPAASVKKKETVQDDVADDLPF